jgi:uncharacterized protein (UPF0333 family)
VNSTNRINRYEGNGAMTETLTNSCQRLAPQPGPPAPKLSMKIPTWAFVLVIALVAVAAVVGIAHAYGSWADSAKQAGAAYQQAGQNLQQAASITMDEYNAIQTGMTLEQVQRVMGWDGTQTESAAVGGQTGSTYQWQNANTEITVEFLNGTVSVKGQYGL